MSSEDAPVGPDGPDWIRQAIALTWDEARSFVATALGFIRRPGHFCSEWLAGRQRALNPLGFVATSLAICGLVDALVGVADGGLLLQLARATLPYVYYVSIGVLAHPLLRLAGGKRRLRASVAVSLFVGGGPGLISALSIYLALVLRRTFFSPFEGVMMRGLPPAAILPFNLLLIVPSVMLITTLILGLAGLHRIARWRAFAAVLVSLMAIGCVLGVLHGHMQLEMGVPHFTLRFEDDVPLPDLWF